MNWVPLISPFDPLVMKMTKELGPETYLYLGQLMKLFMECGELEIDAELLKRICGVNAQKSKRIGKKLTEYLVESCQKVAESSKNVQTKLQETSNKVATFLEESPKKVSSFNASNPHHSTRDLERENERKKEGLDAHAREPNPLFKKHLDWKPTQDFLSHWEKERPDLDITTEIANCCHFIEKTDGLKAVIWDWSIFYADWITKSYYNKTKSAKPLAKTKLDKVMYADRVVYINPEDPAFTQSYNPNRHLEKIPGNELAVKCLETGRELSVVFMKIVDS